MRATSDVAPPATSGGHDPVAPIQMMDSMHRTFRPARTSHCTLLLAACVSTLAACSSNVVRTPSASPARTQIMRSTPKPGATVTVQRGDTLYRIATSNGIVPRDLAAWNGLAEPYTIHPGDRLRLYPGGASATAPRPGTSRASASRPPAARPAAPRPAPVVAAPIESGIAWRWPAEGGLIGRYVAGEPTKQGIDIGGTAGAPVRAAADGVVVYSGAGLVGYGELIILKHNEQWLSAYGHNRSRRVNEGQVVKAGEQIAELGRSGAPRDMLHFEVRYNGKPVDPLVYLPKR